MTRALSVTGTSLAGEAQAALSFNTHSYKIFAFLCGFFLLHMCIMSNDPDIYEFKEVLVQTISSMQHECGLWVFGEHAATTTR